MTGGKETTICLQMTRNEAELLLAFVQAGILNDDWAWGTSQLNRGNDIVVTLRDLLR